MEENKSLITQLVLIILIIGVAVGGFFYWQKNQQTKETTTKQTAQTKTNPVVLGTDNQQDTLEEANSINDSTKYTNTLLQIREPINTSFSDLTDKIKYPKLFTQEDILELVNQIEIEITDAKTDITNLDIASKYEACNQGHIESLDLLLNALNSLKKAYETKDETYIEEFSYNIDKSNSILTNIKIPN